MKRLLPFLIAGSLLLSCSEPKYYEADFQARQEAHDGALKPFMTLLEGISAQEKDALEFLYAYMPLADVTDYSADFYLRNVRSSLETRKEMNWGVPEREFRHFVLPLRV
ncbi:MAG: transglutaminase domain-containing protein, partial [Bacteroidales bacterium]|nr:transglutaminase domain-containing protein [Bacteroidales bacterium]